MGDSVYIPKHKQADGSSRFIIQAPVYVKTQVSYRNKKDGDLSPLRITPRMLITAGVHRGETVRITIRRVSKNG